MLAAKISASHFYQQHGRLTLTLAQFQKCTLLTTAIWQNFLNFHVNLFPLPVILTQIQVKFKKFCQIAAVSRVHSGTIHFWNWARSMPVNFQLWPSMFWNPLRYRIMQYIIRKPWCMVIWSSKYYSVAVLLPCATSLWKLAFCMKINALGQHRSEIWGLSTNNVK